MADHLSYTVDEIAKLLKISKLTVYDLIKKGELVAYRVGKQMRVDDSDLEAYKNRSKGKAGRAAQADRPSPGTGRAVSAQDEEPLERNGLPPETPGRLRPAEEAPKRDSAASARPVVITGQDASLDLLARHLEKANAAFRPLRSFVGSLDSLISMYQGKADIVSTHLLDGDTGEYNVPYTRKLLVGTPHLVVRLLKRKAGLYVRKGNPLRLKDWTDLTKEGVRLMNRERGSGTRVLLDEQLRLHGINAAAIQGYGDEQTNHLGVAAKVASGEADVGIGSEKAAALVSGVEFVPLAEECYDLVLLDKPDNRTLIDTVLAVLRSAAFRDELRAVSGYDVSQTGEIIYKG
ncbi:substrate-binding domain-containing protein [Paenibacillus thailandensis]|uniref:Substrate-binding domain-containing protein n=1 Tax=Paenibacillus thailandensis TaxID=393250 RepID=A0ABW5QYJ6_9BACL